MEEQIDEESMIRVLLVDDQPAVLHGLRVRFQLEPDLQVVGEASTGSEALTLAQALTPDVVLMDIEMPGMDGIQATTALYTVVPQSAVVILSIHTDRQTRLRAQAAGAVAFVEKRGITDTLLAAIRLAAAQVRASTEERENHSMTRSADDTDAGDGASRP
jgi:DNA-binding NarL/FixJ family response regulator